MEFEGEDQWALSGLVRTLSGRFDFLKEGDRGASGTAAAEEARQRSISEDVSSEVIKRCKIETRDAEKKLIFSYEGGMGYVATFGVILLPASAQKDYVCDFSS